MTLKHDQEQANRLHNRMLRITWHSNKRSSANQEIPRILCNSKVHYSIHKRLPTSLSEATSIQFMFPQPTSWRFILILFSHLRLRLPSGPISSVPSPSPQTVYTTVLFPHTCHTRSAHLVLLVILLLLIRIIFGEKYVRAIYNLRLGNGICKPKSFLPEDDQVRSYELYKT